MQIRAETQQDWQAVYQVVSSAFGRSSEAELVEKLRAAGDSVISLVAEEGSQLVGHVLLSRMEAPFPALALAPVSVVPTRQRCGIGSALIKKAVHRARSEGWELSLSSVMRSTTSGSILIGTQLQISGPLTPDLISWCLRWRHLSHQQAESYDTRRRSLRSIRADRLSPML